MHHKTTRRSHIHSRHTNAVRVNYLEDLKACNVQHTNEGNLPLLRVQCLVDAAHQPGEHPLVQGLGQCTNRVDHLRHVLAFLHVLIPDTDPRLEQELCEVSGIDSQHVGHLLSICRQGQWQDEGLRDCIQISTMCCVCVRARIIHALSTGWSGPTLGVLHLGLFLAWPLLDLNVAKVQDSGNSPEQLHLFFGSELQDRHGILGREGRGGEGKEGGVI